MIGIGEVIDETMKFVQRELLHNQKVDFIQPLMQTVKVKKENFMCGVKRR